MIKVVVLVALVLCVFASTAYHGPHFYEAGSSIMNKMMPIKQAQIDECKAEGLCPTVVPSSGPSKCIAGKAGEYPCEEVDLLSFVSLADLGSHGDGNDIWGWTDPTSGHEIAIFCAEDGTSFVDIFDPSNPVVLAFLPTHTIASIWRDVKVYKNHAFIVSEAPNHGMQVYDLTQLAALSGPVVNVTETAYYDEFGSAHNIVINEETGFAYAVGTKTCQGGLHIVDIQDPLNPTNAGCYWQDGYVHDAQCVIYRGGDTRFTGQEICYCYNEDTLTIVNVQDKANIQQLARISYEGAAYTHQGWLTTDFNYVFLNDELDEVEGTTQGPDDGKNTRTLIWDVQSLTDPIWVNTFFSTETVIDHNLYVKNNFVFESNYCGGLRVLELSTNSTTNLPQLKERGYFDVAPACSSVTFRGSWSNYPYFASGNIIVTSIERGLYVVKPKFSIDE